VMKKLQAWIADPRERRRAMIVSAACMLLVTLLIGMQALSPQPVPEGQPRLAKFSIPPKPTDRPIEKAEQKPAKANKTHVEPAVITPATPTKPAIKVTAKRRHKSAGKTVQPAYYVQIGAFRERRHAKDYMQRMRKQGWTLSIRRKKNGMYAVWVGPWPSPKLAKTAKKKLGTQHIRGFIVKNTAQ